MTGTWTPKTNYYVELNQGQLKQVLSQVLIDKMKYKPRKDGQEWTLEHVMRHVKYLAGNKVAISIQITNAKYADYQIPKDGIHNIQNVDDYIIEEDFELAKQMFGVTEFLTQSEYDALIPIE